MTAPIPNIRKIAPQAGPQEKFLACAADVVFYGGCVSGDTEFLTPDGWKRIDQYHGEKVGQWEKGVLSFVQPARYINAPCKELIHFENSRLSMKLSDDHRMPLYQWDGSFVVKLAKDVYKKPSRHIVPTKLHPISPGLDISDDELRLVVAIHADGEITIRKRAGGALCRICVRKQRKKDRLVSFLMKMGLDWREYHNPNRPEEVRYAFSTNIITKNYATFWGASQHQLKVIFEEMSHWDGHYSGVTGGDITFSTVIKEDADFMQYAAHCCGRVASIGVTQYGDGIRSDLYRVNISHTEGQKSVVSFRGDAITKKYVPANRMYCFEVSSSFWVARHNGHIFVTGNSAGGGKSFALLLDPLYNVANGKFGAVIFRRTTKQITNEGGLWDEASELYSGMSAKLNQVDLTAVFPSGMKVTFAHMEHEKHRFGWQGSQIPSINFDEITHFTWKQFIYMLSRNRSMSGVRGQIRGTCNPDPDSWVRRFIDWWIGPDGFAIPERSGVVRWFIIQGEEVIWAKSKQSLLLDYPKSLPKSFTFIRSSVYDNKILLEKDPGYLANLNALTRVEKAQLLDGNWNIRPTAGSYFKRSDFEIVDASPSIAKRVRAWDLAATKRVETHEQKEKKSNDPDWTVGLRMSKVDGTYYIEQIERFREDAPVVDKRIKAIAGQDGVRVKVRLPQDPGQAGKGQAKHLSGMLAGFPVVFYPVTGSKEHRATPLASQAQAGNVKLVRGPWNEAFLSEAENFPEGIHDDQVDAAADAFDELTNNKRAGVW